MMTRIYTIGIAIAVSFALLISSCESTDQQASDDSTTVSVTTAQAGKVELPQQQTFSGTVKGLRRIDLSTKVMGRIVQLDVDEGDFVEQGDLLLQVKDDNLKAQQDQIEAQLSEARANLENTETNYNRIKRLFEQSSATQKEFDDMETRYRMAKAKVKTLEGKLREVEDMFDYTRIEAPIDGYVVQKTAEQGDMASPGRPLLTIENTGALEVRATVPESQVNLLAQGDTVRIQIPAAGRTNLQGRVTAVNPSGNRGSRQFEVKVVFSESGPVKKIKPGMFADLAVHRAGESTIAVNRSALVERGQLTGLYTINNQKEVVLRWVRVGQQTEEQVEILSGIAEGESYVLAPDGRVHEGLKVNIQ